MHERKIQPTNFVKNKECHATSVSIQFQLQMCPNNQSIVVTSHIIIVVMLHGLTIMYERLLEFENKIKVESIYNCIHLTAIGIQFFSIKPHKRNTHVVMYVRRIRDRWMDQLVCVGGSLILCRIYRR